MVTIIASKDFFSEIQLKPNDEKYQLLVLTTNIDEMNIHKKMRYNSYLIGKKVFHGFGGGRAATLGFVESKEEIINQIDGDKIIIYGSLGDSMSPGICILADELIKLKKKVYIIASMPFSFEGPYIRKRAIEVLEEIKRLNCKYEIYNNEELFDINIPVLDLVRKSEKKLTGMIEELVKELEDY